ncbi:MAG: GNAT family N-acetyltransferase [Actinomycetota bacterium]|nr:GNAT family N-acetyltransferase [Actinomycetota bacterium]
MTSAEAASPLVVQTHDGVGDAALVAEWDALAARDPDATVFQRARWMRRWESVLGAQRELRTRTFRSDGQPDGELVGVLCETRELLRLPSGPGELLRLAGGDEVTDYLGPVAAPEDRAAVADAYVAALADDRGWDEIVLGGLATDTGWSTLFADAAARHGLVVVHDDVEAVCPQVDLTGGLGAYLAQLTGRMRNELNRKARKLARDAGSFEVHTYAPADTLQGIEDFLTQVQSGGDDKAAFFGRPEMQQWFRALADEYAADATLRVHRLDIGELNAAMTVSLVDVRTWGLYNSSFDPALAALAPGMVLVWELIERAADEGCTTFDLLRGDEPYKYRFGAVDREVRTLSLARR